MCRINYAVIQSKTDHSTNSDKSVVPGEQAPPADPGQRNFGGPRPATGTGVQAPAPRPPRPDPTIQTVSMDDLSMSDPFIYPDEKSHTYYLTGTGGRLYKSKDLKMWTGPYSIINLKGTWMGCLWRLPKFIALAINFI